jgi:HSP20 family protein
MTNTIRQDRPQRPTNLAGIGGQGWLGSLRWAPREFRDWVAQGGIRIEECREEDSLVIRAELPGVDPLTDVTVTATKDRLAIEAERRESSEEQDESTYRTEFHYGRMFREIPLPQGVKVEQITATFDNGLLNVQVPLAGTEGPEVREIPVLATGKGDGNNGSGGA